jgi:hypothetical protein
MARLLGRFRLYTVREFATVSSAAQDTHPGFFVSDPDGRGKLEMW